MKSLRQLRDELIDVRLQATGVSNWYIQATLTERAERAINDAISTYEMVVRGVYTSAALSSDIQVVAIPKDVGRIYRIETVNDSLSGRREITQWKYVATPQTNLLYINEVYGVRAVATVDNLLQERLDIFYESQVVGELPPDVALIAPALTTAEPSSQSGFIAVSGGTPAAIWRSPGYFELSIPFAATDVREVVRYDRAMPTGFTNLTRAVEGIPVQWTQGAIISAIFEAPERGVPVIQYKAQASMYEFWVRNRALYDQYTALVSEQQLDIGDLLGLSRAMEDKADRSYRRIKQVAEPTRAKIQARH